MRLTRMTAILLLAALTGCKQGTLEDALAARSVGLDANGRAELEARMSEVLGQPVSIAANAFADSSLLVLERRVQRDPAGNRLPGRSLERPERFRLWMNAGQCWLEHEASGEYWLLESPNCEPVPAR